MWSLLGKRDLVNSAKGATYQLPRPTDCFAIAEAFPSDVGGTACVGKGESRKPFPEIHTHTYKPTTTCIPSY